MEKTRVKMTVTNHEGPGTAKPYFKRGDQGYISSYLSSNYGLVQAVIVLDDYPQLTICCLDEFEVVHPVKSTGIPSPRP